MEIDLEKYSKMTDSEQFKYLVELELIDVYGFDSEIAKTAIVDSSLSVALKEDPQTAMCFSVEGWAEQIVKEQQFRHS